jgi:hypothetical protein
MFGFLESPANEALLEDVAPGDSVSIVARLLRDSALLLVDELAVLDEPVAIDLEVLRQAAGEPVTIKGRNACQCQLDLADLPHSCQLGHLHHLQAEDAVIYHYLPIGEAAANVLGQGTHGKTVTVEALQLPGNHLWVESTEIE